MRFLWTVAKVALALLILAPITIIALTAALGVAGALLGLAFLVLKIAVIGLIVVGGFRLVWSLFGGSSPPPVPKPVASLPVPDRHYEAAMRELDRELGTSA